MSDFIEICEEGITIRQFLHGHMELCYFLAVILLLSERLFLFASGLNENCYNGNIKLQN